MGELISPRRLKWVIFEKIYKPCGITLKRLNQLTPANRQAVIDWTRLELMRKENIAAESHHIKAALGNIN